jgi:hypothetical protein
MQQSQLLLLCEKLSKTDWQLVLDFAASPAHNTRKEVAQLLAYIRHYIGKVKDTHLEKEKVWAQLYNRPFEAATLRVLMHLAQQLIQEALAYQHWKSKQNEVHLNLLAALRERKVIEKIVSNELKNTTQKSDNQLLKNQEFYHQQFRLESERYENAIAQKRNTAEGFQALSEALNVYFIAQKLRQACAALSHRSFMTQGIEIDFLQEVLTYVEQKETLRAIPLVALFYHSYHALIDLEDTVHFEQMKKILFASSELFTVAELREYYLHAINCCIKRINTAKPEYIAEVFDIYRKGLETNALLEHEQLSRFTYNNIVMAGVRLKSFDWTEQFIHDYKPFLEEKYRESTFQHSLATFYFKKKDYEKAMTLLHSVEFDDVLHNLDARRMLLCMYYDLAEFESLDAHLEAFKTHLYRQKGIDTYRENYLNLVSFTKRLINLDFSNQKKINELREDILATAKLFEKEWLLAYLD